MPTDLLILELLASKICHDLVSPVGAINNGVELIEDIGGDMVDEAMSLISSSASQAAIKLRLFRLIYGRGGAENTISQQELLEVTTGYFAPTKITAHLPTDSLPANFMSRQGSMKALLMLLVVAEDALIYGGDITVARAYGAFAGGLVLQAKGRNAGLTEANKMALSGQNEATDITTRTIHAYVTHLFLAQHGWRIALEQQPDMLSIHLEQIAGG